MSPTVDNFVHDLVAMAKAYDTLPGLEAENKRLKEQRVQDGDTIARLETRIMELKAQQDETNAKLRSVEAERDDAGFRQLEAEDKIANLVRSFNDVQSIVGHTTAAVTGSGKDITVMMSAAEKAELEAYKAEKAFIAERAFTVERERLAAEEAAKAQPMPESVQPQPEAIGQTAPHWTELVDVVAGQSESPHTVASSGPMEVTSSGQETAGS